MRKVLLTYISGRVHTYILGDRAIQQVVSSAARHTKHSRCTPGGDLINGKLHLLNLAFPRHKSPETQGLLDRDVEKGYSDRSEQGDPEVEDTLTIAISPSSDHWSTGYVKRHELLYRNWTSMELDAHLYPSLPTAPLPIRLLFALPSFLIHVLVRNYFISFHSIQILVLFMAFDPHPNLSSFPLMTLYAIWKFGQHRGPSSPQLPQWVSWCQSASMLLVGHWRIWLWSGIEKRLLGMKAVYEE